MFYSELVLRFSAYQKYLGWLSYIFLLLLLDKQILKHVAEMAGGGNSSKRFVEHNIRSSDIVFLISAQ